MKKRQWISLEKDGRDDDKTHLFHKMRSITRFYKQLSEQKIRENKKMELDAKAGLEITTIIIHNKINNFDKQREDNQLRRTMEEIETKKLEDLLSRIKWQQNGDKCFAKFLRSVRQNKTPSSSLRTWI